MSEAIEFGMWLTTRPTVIAVGASEPVYAMTQALQEWSALRPSPAQPETGGGKVRELEWGPFGASTGLGSTYYVRYHDDETWGWHLTMEREEPARFKTADEAKAAAQADFEQRIRSALTDGGSA